MQDSVHQQHHGNSRLSLCGVLQSMDENKSHSYECKAVKWWGAFSPPTFCWVIMKVMSPWRWLTSLCSIKIIPLFSELGHMFLSSSLAILAPYSKRTAAQGITGLENNQMFYWMSNRLFRYSLKVHQWSECSLNSKQKNPALCIYICVF